MNCKCPKCNNLLVIDLGMIDVFFLRIKCPNCNKILSLNDKSGYFINIDNEEKIKNLKEMVTLSAADGVISDNEMEILMKKTIELGFSESALNSMISKLNIETLIDTDPIFKEEYTEKISDYMDEQGIAFDYYRFMQVIAKINPGNNNLSRYRSDLLSMLSYNINKFKELTRKWEEIYEASTSSSEWDEILDHKNRCNETARGLRDLRSTLEDKNRKEFVEFIKEITKPNKHAW